MGTAEGAIIKADRSVQLRLLDLQHLDSAIAQLAYRRRNLPEHAELSSLDAERRRRSSDLVAADTAVSDLELAQNRAEADLQPVRDRLARDERRIADGSVTDSKALGSLVDEVAHLKKRIADLEDAELEVMEEAETAAAEQARLQGLVSDLDAQIGGVTGRRDEAVRGIDAEAAEHRTERGAVADGLPADLMALYTKIATGRGGVGAAELVQRRCTGCQLEVNAADLRAIRAAADDDVVRCEECSRILVRTDNSGL